MQKLHDPTLRDPRNRSFLGNLVKNKMLAFLFIQVSELTIMLRSGAAEQQSQLHFLYMDFESEMKIYNVQYK